MFEKFTTEGGDTFRRRYEGTYGYFIDRTKNTKPLLVQLVSFEGRNGEVVKFQRLDGVTFQLNANTEQDIGFDFTPPEKRWYPHPTYGAVLGSRRTARQFSRGLCDHNYSLQYWWERGNRFEHVTLTFQEVYNILEAPVPKQMPFSEWVKVSNPPTYYISPLFTIVRTGTSDRRISLRLYDREIATLNLVGDKLTMTLSDLIFTSECASVAKDLGVSEVAYE